MLLLGLLVILFLAQRSGMLLYGYSHIAHPSFDETASGVLACDLLEGKLRAPLLAYQYEARSGDGLLEGFLLVPFFKLFGRSLFSLKLLALASALLTLLCWIALIKRYQGMEAAIIFAALFAFPPVMFARLNLMGTIASHHLINPLVAMQLLLLFRIGEGIARGRAYWLWCCLGLLAGLGAYLFYTYIIFDLCCLLFMVIFFRRAISLPSLFVCLGGLFAGFSPWLLRLLYSPGGGRYLAGMLENIRIEPWRLVQNVLFNLPHSFGYQYPARGMGIVSPLFLLFILCLSLPLVKGFFERRRMLKVPAAHGEPENTSPVHEAGLFFVTFPAFFLLCLSLSPMKIMPFEYWPTFGFFGNFGAGDVYRYRWLYPLFPFYFAITASGSSLMFSSLSCRRSYKAGVFVLLIFFLLWGAGRGCMLFAGNDFGTVFSYRGYSYDQMGSRFIMSDVSRLTGETVKQFVLGYPTESRRQLYKSLGAKMGLEAVNSLDKVRQLGIFLQDTDPDYRHEVVWGIVGIAHNFPAQVFRQVADVVADAFPEIFYTAWGSRHLGYVHYRWLLNREKILSRLSPLERWFFKDYLKEFLLEDPGGGLTESRVLEDIGAVPVRYQAAVCRGLGMLVGSEMLFDPAGTADYPLDSGCGEDLAQEAFREAFYQGVGSGFAETLQRFLRALLVTGDAGMFPENRVVKRERDRCQALMEAVSPGRAAAIRSGFAMGMQQGGGT